MRNIVSKIQGDKAIICIYEEITEWTSDRFISEITYHLENVKKIDIRINSIGGDVIAGFGIFSCIKRFINEGIEINTYNDGICASVAGWLFQAGQKRYSSDFSIFMMHDPYSEKGIDNTNEVFKKFKSSISTILQSKTAFTQEEIEKMMSEETWLDANEQLTLGFCDSVFTITESEKMKNKFNKKTSKEVLFKIANSLYLPKKEKSMKINNLLDLNVEASEEAQVQAIEKLKNKAIAFEDLKKQNGELKSENLNLKNQIKEIEDSRIENAISQAIADAKISDAEKETWKNVLTADFENGFKALNSIKKVENHIDLRNLVGGKSETSKFKNLADEYDYLQKNDVKALLEIKRNDPEKFENMLKEYNNK